MSENILVLSPNILKSAGPELLHSISNPTGLSPYCKRTLCPCIVLKQLKIALFLKPVVVGLEGASWAAFGVELR